MNAPATSTRQPKLAIWMNMPSHHQSAFFEALRRIGCDVRVNYYAKVSRSRREQGWEVATVLPDGERFVTLNVRELYGMPDWKDRLHFVPGYGSAFSRGLAAALSRHRVPWLHWSEAAYPGIRWMLGFPVKARYAGLVNRSALAALAIGDLAAKDFLRWGIKAPKIHFLPYSGMPPAPPTQGDEAITRFAAGAAPLFMHVGVLNRRKGVDTLIDAFAGVSAAHPGARLALVGKDESGGACEKRIEALGLGRVVLVRGVVSFAELGGALQAADVLVLASRFDGWGMVIAEAAAYGKAIIASDSCGASAHLIREGWNGFAVAANDAKALAERMCRYAETPQLAQAHGARSIGLYQDFTPERNARRLLDILLHLRGGQAGNPFVIQGD